MNAEKFEKKLAKALSLIGNQYRFRKNSPRLLKKVFVEYKDGPVILVGLYPITGGGFPTYMTVSGLRHWTLVTTNEIED